MVIRRRRSNFPRKRGPFEPLEPAAGLISTKQVTELKSDQKLSSLPVVKGRAHYQDRYDDRGGYANSHGNFCPLRPTVALGRLDL